MADGGPDIGTLMDESMLGISFEKEDAQRWLGWSDRVESASGRHTRRQERVTFVRTPRGGGRCGSIAPAAPLT